MSKDKRTLAVRVVLNQVLKKANADEDAAAKVPVFIDFVAPPKALAVAGLLSRHAPSRAASAGRQISAAPLANSSSRPRTRGLDDEEDGRGADHASKPPGVVFVLPHPTYRVNGSTTVLIADRDVAPNCARINARHKFFDAVVSLDTIVGGAGDATYKRALQVVHTFSRFVVDRRIIHRLPPSITCKLGMQTAAAGQVGGAVVAKTMTTVSGLEEEGSGLVLTLSQAAKGESLQVDASGRCTLRVGHGVSSVLDVCENAKQALTQLRADFPMVYRFISEVRLLTPVTQPIRLMEVHLSTGR